MISRDMDPGEHQGQCSVLYLPMIDMDTSDLSCVYSTLCYVSSHAKKHNVTPIMTLILISHFGGKHFKHEKVCLKIVTSTPGPLYYVLKASILL